MIQIVTDSTADLGQNLAAEFGIRIVPLSVSIGSKNYRDGIDLGPNSLFALVDENGHLPTTSSPSIAEFLDVFSQAEESLYIGISSELSASLQHARLAAEELAPGRVRIVDSLNLSTGIGLLAVRAAELQDEGLTLDEIASSIIGLLPKVRTSFVLETLEYLHRGGRCTAVEALVGSLLRIRPVIEVRADGTMGVKKKLRGKRRTALRAMLDDFEAHLPELDRHRVFVTHSGCEDDAAFLSEEIARIARPDEVRITQAGSVISSHCGPDTIGILYLIK